jgi:hypothetical protein
LRQGLLSLTKEVNKALPSVGRRKSLGGEFS